MSAAADLYPRPGEFERLIADAEANARGAWEEEFTSSMRFRFERHGTAMPVTTNQVEKLEQIASR